MNKKAQRHYHAHYTGNIPFSIWVLMISIVCMILGWTIPEVGGLLLIGIVLFVLWLGAIIIPFLQEINS